jgi:hypothetical protein
MKIDEDGPANCQVLLDDDMSTIVLRFNRPLYLFAMSPANAKLLIEQLIVHLNYLERLVQCPPNQTLN